MPETSQTETEIIIKIPVTSTKFRKPDVVLLEKFVKVNLPPDYFEAFLTAAIDEEQSVCRVLEKEVRLILRKKVPGLWDEVFLKVPKSETVRLKSELVETLQKINQDKQKELEKKSYEIHQSEIRKQIDRESAVLDKIKSINDETRLKELKEFQKAKDVKKLKEPHTPAPKPKPKPKPPVVVPSVRKRATIGIEFSPHQPRLPKRESQLQYMPPPKSKEAEELKKTGDKFYNQKNFLAAISAYSEAIKSDECRPDLYINRAGAHLAQENFQKCVDDCSKACDLLELNPPANVSKLTAVCRARRGAAYCKLENLEKGYEDLLAALKEDPTNQPLRNDCEMIRCKLEDSKYK